MVTILIRVLLMVLAGIAIGVAFLYARQRQLIYFPTRMSPRQFEAAVVSTFGRRATILAPFDAIVLEPPTGLPIAATAILFHGNASLGLDRSLLAPVFARRGIRLVLAEYPGYGARPGTPTETSLVADARALYAAICNRYPDAPVVLVGDSLGSGVAVQVAAHAPARLPARLVLLTPFLSLTATAARAYRFLPVRWLLKDQFDSATALARFPGPVAILIAGEDEVVGAAQGRSLARRARARGETLALELAQAGHNTWSGIVTEAQWTELLGAPPARPY